MPKRLKGEGGQVPPSVLAQGALVHRRVAAKAAICRVGVDGFIAAFVAETQAPQVEVETTVIEYVAAMSDNVAELAGR
jgi:hypothetical protein